MLRLWWSRVAVTLEASLISSLVFSSLSEFPLLQESAAPNSTSIYFSYITSITGAGFRSGGARPVVDLALEQMNNNTDILPNYTPSYRTIRDSKYKCGTQCARPRLLFFLLVRCDCFFECLQRRFCWYQNRRSEQIRSHLSDPPLLWVLHCHYTCSRDYITGTYHM